MIERILWQNQHILIPQMAIIATLKEFKQSLTMKTFHSMTHFLLVKDRIATVAIFVAV